MVTPYFERREGSEVAVPAQGLMSASAIAAAPAAALGRRGPGLTVGFVGLQCANQCDDVEFVQRLSNFCAAGGRVVLDEGTLKTDGAYGQKTLNAIMAFQRSAQGESAPSGGIEPLGPTLASLCDSRPTDIDPTLLSLLVMRAAAADGAEFTERINKVMANRQSDSKLRQAHFLAQIGHESGEFRFRAEIASGEAYQGRVDLGNLQPGDGQRFKAAA